MDFTERNVPRIDALRRAHLLGSEKKKMNFIFELKILFAF